jgi:hypothetical protein
MVTHHDHHSYIGSSAMKSFLKIHQESVTGVLSGWDRLLFRGTARMISSVRGMRAYMAQQRILLKDFDGWSKGVTKSLREESERVARESGRGVGKSEFCGFRGQCLIPAMTE